MPTLSIPTPNANEFPKHWFLDRETPFLKTRTYLPHWDQRQSLQFITWNLGDALPLPKRKQVQREREQWHRFHPKPWNAEEEAEYRELFIIRWEKWLDAGCGCCLLRNPRASKIVSEALLFFHEDRIEMHSFVIMPNHVHLLVQLKGEQTLAKLLQSWKGFTSHELNRLGLFDGPLWMKDYWDRMIRGPIHYGRVWRYIARNPVKAGLKDGQFVLWQNRGLVTGAPTKAKL